MKKTEYQVIPGQSVCQKCESFLIELAAETKDDFWSFKTDSEDEEANSEQIKEAEGQVDTDEEDLCRMLSQASSNISSSASDNTRLAPFYFKLEKVNAALMALDIPKLTKKEAQK